MSNEEWPNLFVVGAERCGTTSLWSYLRQHPRIYMPKLKEPHYFSRISPPRMRVVHDEAKYKELFAPGRGQPYRGEASPSYLSGNIAEEIARVQPESRIVISLRDPVERAHSIYRRHVRDSLEERSFTEMVRDELEAPTEWSPLATGRYTERVERYLRAFPDRVHVVVFEELAADERREVDRLFEFLGVEPCAGSLDLRPLNPGQAPRNAAARKIYASDRIRVAAHRLVPPSFHAGFERLMLARRAEAGIDADVRGILAEYFAPDREPLERLLGRTLPWPKPAATA